MIGLCVIAPALALRTGLRALLEADGDLQVVAEAARISELEVFPPPIDVAVLTADVLDRGDLEALLEEVPAAIGLLLIGEEPGSAAWLSTQPVRGWGALPPDAAPEELGAAVRAVHAGLVVGAAELLTPLLSRRLVTGPGAVDEQVETLTEREVEVLGLLARGLANKQIASELNISEHTAKFHVSSIYAKLGATNRAEAVRLGARRGLILL